MKRLCIILLVLSYHFSTAQQVEKDSVFQVIEKELGAVEITAGVNDKLFVKKTDRIIFNIDQMPTVSGGDVLDIFRNMPGLRVQNDKIMMVGKGDVLVMIDDRVVQLSGNELSNYLKSIKASEIKKVEIMSNPPAKYVAEGNSGVINIITKSAKKNSWNSTLSGVLQQHTYATGRGGITFDFQKNKWTLSSAVNYVNGISAPLESNNIYYEDETWREEIKSKNFANNFSARVNLDYKISDNWNNGIIFNVNTQKPLDKSKTGVDVMIDDVIDKTIYTDYRNEKEKQIYTLNYHLIYKNDNDMKISFDYDRINFRGDDNSKYTTGILDSNSFITKKNLNYQKINNNSVNLDFEHILDWGSINYGLRASFSKTNNDFKNFDVIDNKEYINANISNIFHYRENTQAIYFSAEKETDDGEWELQAGIRLENTQIKGYSETINQTNKGEYIKLFPTFYVVHNPTENHSISLNYGKRIHRPDYVSLNPFRVEMSQYSYTEGNPFLQPSYSHNVELEFSYKDWNITNLYFSRTEDGFDQLLRIDNNTKINYLKYENYLKSEIYGLSQSFILNPYKWWKLMISADVYYSKYKSNISVAPPLLSGWNGDIVFNNDFILNKNKTLFFSMNYLYATKGVNNMDKMSAFSNANISFKALLLEKRMTINLFVDDIFKKTISKLEGYSNGIKNDFENYHDRRGVRLSLSYNFGKSFKSSAHIDRNQEEKERIR